MLILPTNEIVYVMARINIFQFIPPVQQIILKPSTPRKREAMSVSPFRASQRDTASQQALTRAIHAIHSKRKAWRHFPGWTPWFSHTRRILFVRTGRIGGTRAAPS